MTQQHRWILGGGLASGKTVVRELITNSGITTIDADRIGHSILEPGGPAFVDVAQRWPQAVIDGSIDRKILARIVFSDSEHLAALETITHPHIFDTIKGQVEQIEGAVVVEMPIISDQLDGAWRRMVVDSREEAKLERAVTRGMDRDDARARLARQPTRVQWLAVADIVIPNHGPLVDLEDAVAGIVPHL